MKITRPKVDSDVRYSHAEVLLSLINQLLEMPSSADGPETSVREWFLLESGATPVQSCKPDFHRTIGRERRERLSQLAWRGEGCFDLRRRVNSTVMSLLNTLSRSR